MLVTDHKSLTTIPNKKIPVMAAARLQRWAIILSAYSYDIEFCPTERHGNADGLSDYHFAHILLRESLNISQMKSLPVSVPKLRQATSTDPVLSQVLRYTQRGWPQSIDSQ